MTDRLMVLMDDRVAGTLTRSRSDRTDITFEYDDHYRYGSRATPLSLSIPLQVKIHPSAVMTPWLWGLLPDNAAVLERWTRTFQISGTSPFAFLGTPIGEDCAGAVRFVTPDRLEAAIDRAGTVSWLSPDEVGDRLRALREDSTSWLGANAEGRFSLAGAQAKTALLRQDGRWGLPEGSTPTSHILKPAIAGFDDHDLNEHVCLTAAALCGLSAAPSRIEAFGDERAVVVERFDRLLDPDGRLQRVHQEDMCQALGVAPSQKYQSDGGPSTADISDILERHVQPNSKSVDRQRFIDAILFNWVIGGTDAHAKNYGVLLSGPAARMAPLYDLGSALPYPGLHLPKLKLAMKLGQSYSLSPSSASFWPKVADEFGRDLDALLTRASFLIGAIPDAVSQAAHQPAVADLGSTLPARLVDGIAARAKQCAAWLP